MNHRPWHERLDAAMKRRGVPAKFRRRLLAEASDHADDLTEGGDMSDATMEARMGEPDDVAATAADQYRRATWTRRHPLLVFGLLPVPLFVLMFVLTELVLGLGFLALGLATGAGEGEGTARWFVVAFGYGTAWANKFVPFLLMVWFFTRRFVRSGVHWGWYAAAMAQVLFFAVTLVSTVQYSDTPGESSVVLHFLWIPTLTTDGWAWMPERFLGWSQVFQLLVPAALAWALVKLAKRRQVALAA